MEYFGLSIPQTELITENENSKSDHFVQQIDQKSDMQTCEADRNLIEEEYNVNTIEVNFEDSITKCSKKVVLYNKKKESACSSNAAPESCIFF